MGIPSKIASGQKSNLITFEEIVGKVAYYIIIFLEAPEALAKIGSFSKNPNLVWKVLSIIDLQYQCEESFLALGPVDLINGKSIFGPAIYIDYKKPKC